MKALIISFVLFIAFEATIVFAALTTDQQTAVDGINTLISALISATWLIFAPVLSTLIGMKLFKYFLNKAVQKQAKDF